MKLKKSTRRSFLGATAFAVLCSGAGVAHAQSESEGAAEVRSSNIIVVTARKSEENLLQIPVAVTAFGAEQIENIGLDNIEDIQGFTPGFSYESFGTTEGRLDNVPRFRGIAVNTAAPTRQTASVFVDGIFVANGVQGIDFQDLERIEVIKGPQSAFFGRNTFGGAINFITKTPSDDLEFHIGSTIATRDLYELNGSANIPISDSLKVRVSASFRDKGGHYRSITDGGRAGDEQTWSIGGTVFFQPSDNFDAKIRVNYFENDDGVAAATLLGQRDLNCGPTALEGSPLFNIQPGQAGPFGGTGNNSAFFCGVLPETPVVTPTMFGDTLATNIAGLETLNGPGTRLTQPGLERRSLRTSLQFNVRFPDSDVVLSWLTGLNYDEVDQSRFSPNTGTAAFATINSRQFRDFSQEIRFAGTSFDEFLDWSVGGNYFDQRFSDGGPFGTAGGFLFNNGDRVGEEQIETFGLFGSLGLNFTEQLNLTLEGRYQIDKIADDDRLNFGDSFQKGTFKNFLPRVILEYKPTDSTLVYASFSEGNLPGGFNTDVSALSPTDLALLVAQEPFTLENFEEETLRQYELGLKQSFDGGRGSIAIAAYYLDRTGQQFRTTTFLTRPDLTTFTPSQTINAGESEAYGLEVEAAYELFDGFNLSGTMAYIDSEYKVFNSSNALRVFGDSDASGKQSERFPKWTGSLSAQYNGELNADWGWFVRGDGIYTGKRYTSEVNLAEASAATVVNLRLGVKSDDIRLEAFVTNLTDEDSPIAAARSTDLTAGRVSPSPFGFLIGLRDRRQFGIRTSFNF